jgi:hypothetical protein
LNEAARDRRRQFYRLAVHAARRVMARYASFGKKWPRREGCRGQYCVALVGNTQNNKAILADLSTVVHRLCTS